MLLAAPPRSEYFAQGDSKECEACIAEVAASQRAEYCTRLVSRAIDLSLDKREREQEMVSALFVQLSRAGARCRQPRPVAPLLEQPRALPAGALARELLAAGFAEVAEFVEDLVADIPKAQEIFDGSAENVPSFNPKTNPVRTVALPTGCGPTLSAKACWPQKLRVRQSLCPLRSRSRSNLRG